MFWAIFAANIGLWCAFAVTWDLATLGYISLLQEEAAYLICDFSAKVRACVRAQTSTRRRLRPNPIAQPLQQHTVRCTTGRLVGLHPQRLAHTTPSAAEALSKGRRLPLLLDPCVQARHGASSPGALHCMCGW